MSGLLTIPLHRFGIGDALSGFDYKTISGAGASLRYVGRYLLCIVRDLSHKATAY